METIQNKSLKRMLRLPQGTPSQALRAELGIYSIESVISRKRLMFLHRVLNQPDENITKKVLLQQINLPEETWLSNTLILCEKVGLCHDLETIENTPKYKWRKLVNVAIENVELDKLREWTICSKK